MCSGFLGLIGKRQALDQSDELEADAQTENKGIAK